MFHLWIGMLAGVLLAYLWSRGTAPEASLRRALRSWRWWMATLIILVLFLPMLGDLVRVSLSRFGIFEALKTVLLPWATGVGFGIWLYSVSVPVARESATLSWLPLLVTVLFATAVVSEERYGWFSRLQKISVAGGGLEFAAAPSQLRGAPDRSPLQVSGVTPGRGQVGAAIDFMASLPDVIARDRNYARELGMRPLEIPDADMNFFTLVAVPLGAVLKSVHDARGYNDVAVLVDRGAIENFRALTAPYLTPVPPAGAAQPPGATSPMQDYLKVLHGIWLKACDTEFRLRQANHISRDPRRSDEAILAGCRSAAEKALGAQAGTAATAGLSPSVPYGALLSAMLLNAAGETDLAVRDLERWLKTNSPLDLQDPLWVMAYRVRYTITTLSMRTDPKGTKAYAVIGQYRKLLEIGDRFLANTFPSNVVSWREQVRRLESGDRTNPIWHTAVCALDLSENFKRLMLAHLNAANNFAFLLSENPDYAQEERLEEEMEQRANYVVGTNLHCLQRDAYSPPQQKAAYESSALFLETAANVQLVLAGRETLRATKRARLCAALTSATRAGNLYHQAMQRGPGEAPLDDEQRWKASEMRLLLARTTERVRQQLATEGLDC